MKPDNNVDDEGREFDWPSVAFGAYIAVKLLALVVGTLLGFGLMTIDFGKHPAWPTSCSLSGGQHADR